MINVCFINGSPRKQNSGSSYFISELTNLFSDNVNTKEYFISNIMKDKALLEEIISYDKIVFVCSLYVDCLHSSMLDFMYIFEDSIKEKGNVKLDMYSIVNCGFIEGTQNEVVLNIMENYCKRLNFNWRFGVGIGGGEFMSTSKDMPLDSFMKKPVYNGFLALKEDIENNSTNKSDNIFVNAKMPKFLFKFFANNYWKVEAKKNNLKTKELYNQIY